MIGRIMRLHDSLLHKRQKALRALKYVAVQAWDYPEFVPAANRARQYMQAYDRIANLWDRFGRSPQLP